MSTLCASNFQRNISQFEHDFWSKHPDTYPLFIKYQVSASKSKWAMFFCNHQLDPKFAQFPSTWIYLEKSVEIKGITFLQTISWMWCFRTICIDHFPRISPQFFTSFVLPQGNFLVGWPKKTTVTPAGRPWLAGSTARSLWAVCVPWMTCERRDPSQGIPWRQNHWSTGISFDLTWV